MGADLRFLRPAVLRIGRPTPSRWTAEWLLHYEVWLATGEWLGDHGPAAQLPDHYDNLPGL